METNIDTAAGVIVKSDQTGRTRYAPEYKRDKSSRVHGLWLVIQSR
jgi:hypothetical protein